MKNLSITLVEIFERFLLPMIVLMIFVVIITKVNALDAIMDGILSTLLGIIF